MPATIVGTAMIAAQPASFFVTSFLRDGDQREVRLERAGEEPAQRVDRLVGAEDVVVDVT